jgi:hypothetical protein
MIADSRPFLLDFTFIPKLRPGPSLQIPRSAGRADSTHGTYFAPLSLISASSLVDERADKSLYTMPVQGRAEPH